MYEAFDREHQAKVALKLLHGRSGDPLARFKREFRALQSVRHPNIVSFGELFSDGDEWFFTMELLSGMDFRTFVRRGPTFDESRVRHSIAQLADALSVLHAVGIVHRDIKPANIMMSVDGRATLVDFGVVKDESSVSQSSPDLVSFVGTPAYMSPEQISGDAGPAADCYAVGVMLYEALVGKLPFGGKVADVLHAKQIRMPLAPHVVDVNVPRDLGELAIDLLAIEPEMRPTADEIVSRLTRSSRATSSAPPSSRTLAFVGRAAELIELRAAYDVASNGATRVVLIEGESGIGKSTLVRHFGIEIRAHDESALVLTSRCRETEWIPYKAFDGLIEGLSRFMRTLGDADAAVLLPVRAALVAQVFPSLMQVASVATAPVSRQSDVDAVHQRAKLFAAVRELFARVAQRYRLVLFIDDLQWADPDSMALLADVLRGPEAPALLLLATARGDAFVGDATPKSLRDARRVRLGPMPPGDAKDLARKLAARSDATLVVDAGAIALEAEGHPLFIHELVCHAVASGDGTSTLRLDEALAARIALLDGPAREMLECVALAARPITRGVVARATSLQGNDTYRLANLLCAANLVKRSGAQAEKLEPFHDRVRQAVVKSLPPARAMKRHRRIAAALESGDGRDTEALAYHWREANKPDRAAKYAEEAAAEAERAFAFDQAAHLYTMALELGAPTLPKRVALLTKLGDALANGGRSDQAADAYRRAAASTSASEAVTHLQKAADQLIRAGHIQEGLALALDVLDQLGVRAPKTRWRAFASFLFWRCFFAVRGLAFRERSLSQISAHDLAKIDTAWSITSGLSTIDPIRGAYFQMRHLRMALDAGEPYRVVRAVALQIGYGAGPGAEAWMRSERMTAQCGALSERIGHPHGVALTRVAAGIACYLQGRFERSLVLFDDAEQRLRACPGTWGEIARTRRFALSALASLGRMRELRARVYAQLRDAREHGDMHALTNLRIGHPNLVWLMEDDVDAARHELRAAMTDWSLPGFHLEQHYELLASTNIDLYDGDPERARARQLDAWSRLEASHLLRIPAARVLATSSRARTAIAIAARDKAASAPLLHEAEALAKRIAREPLPFAVATSALLHAGIAFVRGRSDEAIERVAFAECAFYELDMRLHAAAARRWHGELLGHDMGRALVREADEWMEREGIASPRRMAAMVAPGFAA